MIFASAGPARNRLLTYIGISYDSHMNAVFWRRLTRTAGHAECMSRKGNKRLWREVNLSKVKFEIVDGSESTVHETEDGTFHITVSGAALLRNTTADVLKASIQAQQRAWDLAAMLGQALGTDEDINHLVVQLAVTHDDGDEISGDALDWLLSTATNDFQASLQGQDIQPFLREQEQQLEKWITSARKYS
jgi:hypothetical protein